MKKIINLTGHEVVIMQSNGEKLTIPAEGRLRAQYTTNNLGELETHLGPIPITKNFYLRLRDMPEEKPNVLYVVSRLVAELYPERNDFLMVNGLIKSDQRTVACRSLSRI